MAASVGVAESITPFIFEPDANPGQAYAATVICASSTTPINARQTLRKNPRVMAAPPEPDAAQRPPP